MTTIDSATAHAYIKQTEFTSTPEIVFDRAEVEKALEEVGRTEGVVTPSAKSFLDWARRYDVVERVEGSRGLYRWTQSVEDEAVEVGRQIAAENRAVPVPDTDPENPMVLMDEDTFAEKVDAFGEEFSSLIDALAESFEEMGDGAQRTADAIQATAQAYPEDLHLIIDDVPRLPRKLKKQMKRDLITHTAARKVTFSFAGVDR